MKTLKDAQRRANTVRIPLTAGRLGLADFVRGVGREMKQDHVGSFAGSLTYHGLLALFPFLIFILSMLGLFGVEGVLTRWLDQIAYAIPAEASELLNTQIERLTDPARKSAFTISAIVSALIALWGVSGAFRSTMEAMNVMYGVEESRGFLRRYATSILMSIGMALLFVSALALVVAGTSLARWIAGESALGDAFVLTWSVLQWPLLVTLVLFAFAAIYYVAPSVEQDFRFVTPGSAIGVTLWLLFSLAFSLYVNNFGSYDATYGALAGIIVLMLYLYYSSMVLLLGAEMNQVVEEAHPRGKAEGDKRSDGA